MMLWLRLGLILLVVTIVAGGGFWAGEAFQMQRNQRVLVQCGRSIETAQFDRCPTPIAHALQGLQLAAANQTIDRQDRVVVVQGQSNAAELRRLETLRRDLIALAQTEQTNACASSPALRTLRNQLCASSGTGQSDCGPSGNSPG